MIRKIVFTLCGLGLAITGFAQKFMPEIKAGTTLNATVFVQSQEVPVTFTIKRIETPITLAWFVDGYGEGAFELSQKAYESGKEIYTQQPPQGTTKLSDSETYGLISKDAYKSLTANKSFTYNGLKFKPKETGLNPMKLDGKEIDATQVASEDGKIELWILNNPNFPLILQSAGLGLDVVIHEIK
ncbi:hypothetical protein [Pedobacter sp. ASV12]|uniref:hypothetical protein n=1 Tax=Pedobacter sp. ASV12 TaxID=2795120 RepID=UPI0018EC358B|nr:hypothetical protein [Pedobacter sp. ASV12]